MRRQTVPIHARLAMVAVMVMLVVAAGCGQSGPGSASQPAATPGSLESTAVAPSSGVTAPPPLSVPPSEPATPSSTGPTPTVPTTSPGHGACVERLPVDQAIDRIPLVLVEPGEDLAGVVDRIGGVGLIGDHTAESVAALRARLDATAFPPLLASDEEGGRIGRLSGTLGEVPAAADVSDLPDDEVGRIYRGYADGMAELGIDVNFAPVLATGDTALGDRSYGPDPEVVAHEAGIFVDAMHEAGVLPVLKHFPGLGEASVNTDFGSATGPDLDRLRSLDLVPYELLRARPEPVGVMMSHLVVPGLSGGLPTSLSPAAYALLRDEYGYHGLVVTDSLSAEAITGEWTVPEAAVLAVEAGADMVLFKEPAQVEPVLEALLAAVDDGSLPQERVRDAAAAVLAAQGIDPCELT